MPCLGKVPGDHGALPACMPTQSRAAAWELLCGTGKDIFKRCPLLVPGMVQHARPTENLKRAFGSSRM